MSGAGPKGVTTYHVEGAGSSESKQRKGAAGGGTREGRGEEGGAWPALKGAGPWRAGLSLQRELDEQHDGQAREQIEEQELVHLLPQPSLPALKGGRKGGRMHPGP